MKAKTGKLLLVDDEAVLLEILRSILEDVADSIDVAVNGQMGIEKMLVNRYDAVISDIEMPLMTGMQMLNEMREREIEVPVVILTSYSDKYNILQAFRLGALDFIEKPFDPDHLRQVARAALDLGISNRNYEEALDRIVSEPQISVDIQRRISEVKKEARLLRKALLENSVS